MKGLISKKEFNLFIFPTLLLIGITIILPFMTGVYYSLTEWNGNKVTAFLGLKNYLNVFRDTKFWNSMIFTFKFTIASTILMNVIGLGLALIVTRKQSKMNNLIKSIYFMPNLIGGIILGFIWQFIFIKAFNSLGDVTGLAFLKDWLSTPTTGFWGLVILYVWQMAGYIMLIYVSFINNISQSVIEAARVDGASAWTTFWKIKLPLLAPALTVTLFLSLSGAFKVYDQNMALTGGGPYESTQMVTMNIYNEAFVKQNMGYAQSKAAVFLLVVAMVSFIQIYITRKKEKEL
ncbi:carbohydrate ABC transporter permease [Erysipelothrix urinaevulpis]|uniref:carbohydrate ABC transporter permease n=1 Tax=Erysipelothrix urinaevulpis TaxID=2683717 RepID=UPI0019162E21|nr:sugar ABC transporter permease [Erysipelothrix urinaevulpis]